MTKTLKPTHFHVMTHRGAGFSAIAWLDSPTTPLLSSEIHRTEGAAIRSLTARLRRIGYAPTFRRPDRSAEWMVRSILTARSLEEV